MKQRAKLLLRAQLCESVRDFLHLCREGLATFLREVRSVGSSSRQDVRVAARSIHPPHHDTHTTTTNTQPRPQPGPRAGSVVEADINELDVPEKIRSALQKEALFIVLATGMGGWRVVEDWVVCVLLFEN